MRIEVQRAEVLVFFLYIYILIDRYLDLMKKMT